MKPLAIMPNADEGAAIQAANEALPRSSIGMKLSNGMRLECSNGVTLLVRRFQGRRCQVVIQVPKDVRVIRMFAASDVEPD